MDQLPSGARASAYERWKPIVRGQWPAMAALAVGIACTLATASLVRDWELADRRTLIERTSAEYVEALRGRLIGSLEVLYSIDSFLAAREQITREEFRDFVAPTLVRRPELQGLAWDPRILEPARDAWEARARRDGLDEFRVVEQRPDGALVPAARRPEYFPVFFMEHVPGNEAALGFDLGSEPLRRAALERARDTGRPTATPPIRLIQEPGSQLGFLVLLPVYARQARTEAERREALRGVAVAVYRIGDLAGAALGDAAGKGLNVSLVDAETGLELYRRDGGSASTLPSWETRLDAAGRAWVLRFQPTHAFAAARSFWQAWAALAGGLAITLLVAAFLWSHSRRLAATETRVREATRELSLARDELEARVQQRTAQLAAANRAKSTFLANVSHEIRTPLNAILGYAQILVAHGRLDPFQHDAVHTIAGSSDHLLHLINEILDLSKIDAGRLDVVRTEFDLRALLRELTVMFRPLCDEKQLTLVAEVPATEISACVGGDARLLRQVLINLLGNAVKFTARGGVTLRAVDRGGGRWQFDVEDTGPGIPPDVRERVFEPFHQGPSGEAGGTGLGLTIARRLTEAMGGTLTLDASPRDGSLFRVEVDLPAALALPVPQPAPSASRRVAPGYTVRALVVDDVVENRAVLSTMLRMAGCHTFAADTAADGVRAVAEFEPDIVFMDVRLPGGSGLDAATRIASDARRPRIVATSASVLDGERARSLAAGCDLFLAKPIRIEDVLDCVATLLQVPLVVLAPTAPEPAEITAIDLADLTLPEDLMTRMHGAAERHSATALKSCLAELDAVQPGGTALATLLRGHLASFDMDRIKRVLADVSVACVRGHHA